MQVISDEMLDLYVVEELSAYWHKLGKALCLEDDLLQKIYDKSPEDPPGRLRIILREWRDTAENPSLDLLDVILEQLGLKSSIPDRRGNKILYDATNTHTQSAVVLRACHLTFSNLHSTIYNVPCLKKCDGHTVIVLFLPKLSTLQWVHFRNLPVFCLTDCCNIQFTLGV